MDIQAVTEQSSVHGQVAAAPVVAVAAAGYNLPTAARAGESSVVAVAVVVVADESELVPVSLVRLKSRPVVPDNSGAHSAAAAAR